MNDKRVRALSATRALRERPMGHFVAGRAVEGEGKVFDITEPGTGELLGQATDATPAELESAVAAAREA
ncbi:MAG TPA: 5-carboxymethyl-2-hydroxymuconate semialdehyde dehydrogenase, partial [Sphingobium sp.]|nr:5-carboxymethyl-2-hydroxymuconate semialdehyde dehydrogenase [Sphingobium sp.]